MALDWIVAAADRRINAMLAYLAVASTGSCADTLTAAGRAADALLRESQFQRPVPPRVFRVRGHDVIVDTGPTLTEDGAALAADLGLLLARCLRERRPELEWRLGTGPRSYVSLNHPVLAGFRSRVEFDLLLVGRMVALGAARLEPRRRTFADVLKAWIEMD